MSTCDSNELAKFDLKVKMIWYLFLGFYVIYSVLSHRISLVYEYGLNGMFRRGLKGLGCDMGSFRSLLVKLGAIEVVDIIGSSRWRSSLVITEGN